MRKRDPNAGRSRVLFVDSLAAVVASSLLLAVASVAHPSSDYYPATWSDNPVTWRFKDDFPPGEFRGRVREGSDKWTSLSGSLTFHKLEGDASGWQAQTCPGYMRNAVHIGPDDGPNGTLAFVYRCYFFTGSSVVVESGQIKFDIDEAWYRENATPVPGSKYDVESVAAHEFGHETGWSGHFGENWDVCEPGGDWPRHTMCPTVPPGTDFWRTLEEHDRHTFNGAY